MATIDTVRTRLRVAGIVSIVVGALIAIGGMVHATIGRYSQVGPVDVTIGISGVTVLFVGFELIVARFNLRRVADLTGTARSSYLIQMIVLIVLVGSVLAAIFAALVAGYIYLAVIGQGCSHYGEC